MSEVTLKEYVDRHLALLERAMDAKLESIEKAVATAAMVGQRAVEKAEAIIDRRLEGMNEFREAMKDQTAHFLTRKESDLWRENIQQQIRSLEVRMDKREGRSGGRGDFWGWVVAAFAILATLVALADRFAR